MLNDIDLMLKYAERFAAVHPELYLDILENEKYTDNMVSIGMKAIDTIPEKYIMRSKAALKTAEYINEINGERSLLEKCYFAAYESDTSAMNYWRALLNDCGNGNKREQLRNVFMKFSYHKDRTYFASYNFENSYLSLGREENKPDKNMLLLLKFLDGQFEEVLDTGLNKSEALGWLGSFMKQGIALYLLYLYEDSRENKGITAMTDMAKTAIRFSAEEYRRGTCGLDNINENDLFRTVFLKWKSMVQIKSDVRERAIKKITALLEKRTEGIMNENRRNYYGECAAYIAALGEVRESLGETGAKQRLMTSYKDKYPRRTAFREAMRNYGWIDSKKR